MNLADHNHPFMGLLVRPLIALSLAFALCVARPAAALDTGDIVVASIKGEVHIEIRGTDTRLRAGAVLELPATVRTGRDGAVELRQGATSISVGPETLLEFPALTTPGGSIDRVVQPRGTAFYNVGKRGGRKLRIETPFLVGVVKGTQFSVVAQDHATNISLFEGLLEVRAADDSDVIDLHAGEIASRDRAATDISVIRMEAGATPPAQTVPATKPLAPNSPAGAGGSPATPSSNPPRPTGNVVGEPLNAQRDHGPKPAVSLTDTIPTRPDVQASFEVPAGNGAANAPVDVSTPANNGANVDVAVDTSRNSGVSVDLSVDTPANTGANVDVSADTPGNNGGNVDVSIESPANNGANVDLSVDTPAGNGGGTSVEVGVETPAGNVVPNVGAVIETPVVTEGVNVDLGGGAVVDTTEVVGVDVGAGANAGDGAPATVDVNAGNGAATVDMGANVDVNNGVGVDAGVGLGNSQVNLGADLGAVTDIDLGLGENDSDNSGPGSDNSGSGSSGSGSDNSGSGNSGGGSDNSGPGNLVEDLLGGLTRRSGKR